MSDLWSQVKKLFGQAEQSSRQQPVTHTLIERSPEDQIFKETYLQSLKHFRFKDWIKDQYQLSRNKGEGLDDGIDFLNTRSSKGFVLHLWDGKFARKESQAIFDHFKDQVLSLGYRSYLSDSKSYSQGQWTEELERHYLKPPMRREEVERDLMDQHFGNINIELLFRNTKPWQLKLSATTYSDRSY
ncbi:MAG: hypothetical protein HKN16_03465, partial [Saprospiraceae bacterium]|nr:hypothetical protein [Saprospiraceae bacterium]